LHKELVIMLRAAVGQDQHRFYCNSLLQVYYQRVLQAVKLSLATSEL